MTAPTTSDLAAQRPTHVRHFVVWAAVLMSVLLYLDRFCISFAAPYIKEDLGLNDRDMALILGAFFLSYAFGQVPSGWLSDRFGPRLTLTLYILIWSLFTGLTGLAMGFAMVFALRLGIGVGQAGAYPSAAGLISKWVPVTSRGKASSAVSFGGRVGGTIAPIITAYLIVMFVPSSTSSRFTGDDLLSFAGLRKSLTSAKANSPTARLYERLPSQAKQALSSTAGEQSGLAAQRQAVVDGLNDVLGQRDFYDAAVFKGVLLPKQATLLLRRPADTWSSDEVERLNRLTLEAIAPKDLRKVYVAGWRPVMFTYGIVGGLLVAGLCWIVLRNRPEEHSGCNEAEVALIRSGRPATLQPAQRKVQGVPLKHLACSPSMCFNSISQVGTNIGWAFLVTLLPRYLVEVHQVPVEMRGWMAATPLFVGWLGVALGGYVTDRLVKSIGLRWGRALPIAFSKFIAMAAYLVCLLPLAERFGSIWTPWVLTLAFSMVAFGTDLGIGAIWAFCQDVGGRHVGSVLGWGNMWGNLAAASSPLLLNWIVGPNAEHWNLAFLTCSGSFLIAGLAALGIDATKPIVPEEEEAV